ncbi:gag-pol polyprotein [Cucumis melo var. makuwa]|uniref:Gag-pol polyprotein n=1 Tax=Cucumis melo var. makuwa TaxID=1194695 RepID=A0A5D3D6D3_CUCMM|nr:gag-pol polyprotein [Cucumis melo var. makuwa]
MKLEMRGIEPRTSRMQSERSTIYFLRKLHGYWDSSGISNDFRLINTCKSAKATWDILEVVFEGTSKVKISRLQILISRFEALQMTEDETIAESSIANRRKPGLALTSVKEELTEERKVPKNNDIVAESVVLLTNHIQSECATYLKHKKKNLVATFSNEEDYSESDDEEVEMALINISTMNDEEAAKVNSQASDQLESTINKCLNDGLMERKWEEDQEIILQQQERIQCLVE